MAMAASMRQARQYQRAQVESASPTQLVVMLYDGAIRFLSAAIDKIAAGEIEERHRNIVKAQNILAELMSTLDREKGGEVAENLFRIYHYCYNLTVEANLYDDAERLHRAVASLRDLRESWAAIDRMERSAESEQHTQEAA
jgi:flagellar protein FliS